MDSKAVETLKAYGRFAVAYREAVERRFMAGIRAFNANAARREVERRR